MKTKATKKGQIVIPANLRRKYGIEEGTRFNIRDNEGQIILEPITDEYITSLRGIAKDSGTLNSLMRERKKDREREDG